MRALITIAIYLLVAGLLYWFISQEIVAFSHLLSHLEWHYLLLCLFLQIPIIFFLVWPSTYLINTLGYGIRLIDVFLLSHVCNLLNNILPYRPGIGVRWLFLKHHYNIPTKTFLLNSVCFYSLALLIALFVFIGTSAFLQVPTALLDIDQNKPLQILGPLMVVGIGFIYFIYKKSKSPHEFKEYFLKIRQHKERIPIFIGSLLLNILLMAACLSLCFIALGQPIHYLVCIWLISATVLTSTFHVTPGNIGISEFIIGSLTQFLINDFNIGFAAFLLFRITQISAAALIGFPSIHYVMNGHRSAIFKPFSANP